MANLLAAAREKYDYIFIDLPPLQPVVDAKAAAHLIDRFIFVVEWRAGLIPSSLNSLLVAIKGFPCMSQKGVGGRHPSTGFGRIRVFVFTRFLHANRHPLRLKTLRSCFRNAGNEDRNHHKLPLTLVSTDNYS
jgi:hypothetical protein